MKLDYPDKDLFLELKQGKVSVFKRIYDDYWYDLYRYAYNIVRDKGVSEEIVQETFFSLWNKRQKLQVDRSMRAYLFTAVKYQTISHIRAAKVRTNYAAGFAWFESTMVDNSNEENIHFSDLKRHIEVETAKLPEKCRQIFQMSRNEHQSVQAISDMLNLSHKTVENQLSKALKHLRSSLGHFLFVFVAFALSL